MFAATNGNANSFPFSAHANVLPQLTETARQSIFALEDIRCEMFGDAG